MNETNFRKLATHLIFKPQEEFDMAEYRVRKEKLGFGLPPIFGKRMICKTTACALGAAIDIPGLEPGPDDHLEEVFSWDTYCERIFGVQRPSAIWSWVFDYRWEKFDNTPRGAAARIIYLLQKGVPPVFKADYYKRDLDTFSFHRGFYKEIENSLTESMKK